MTSQPNAMQYGNGGLAPVLRSIWKFFCDIDVAKGVLNQVKALGFADAKLVDGNLTFFGDSLVYLDQRVQAHFIQGTMKRGDETFTVNESAGFLTDRMTVPNPFVDRNADGSVGGPVLKYVDIGNGIVELYWGK